MGKDRLMDSEGIRVLKGSTEVWGIDAFQNALHQVNNMALILIHIKKHLWCSFVQSPQPLDDPKSSLLCAHRQAGKNYWVEQVHNKNVDVMAQQFIYITDIAALIFVRARENDSEWSIGSQHPIWGSNDFIMIVWNSAVQSKVIPTTEDKWEH